MTKAHLTLSHDPRDFAQLEAWTSQRTEEALEPELPIVDTHHHLADDDRGCYLLDELARDTASGHNIIASVFVEYRSMYRADGPEAMQPVGEVEFVNGLAAVSASGRYGATRFCAGIVGHAELRMGAAVQPVLEALVAAGNGRFRGIRYGVGWLDTGKPLYGPRQVPQHLLSDATFRKGYAQLGPLGLSYDAWLFYTQLEDLSDLLRAFPKTNVIVNHCGGMLGIPPCDGKRDEVFATWRARIRELAQFPNVSVKLGGLGMPYSGWGYHMREAPPNSDELAHDWRPYVEACMEAFGVERCMMESNFPADKKACGYGVLWNAMKRITQGCSSAEKAALYRDTAARVYRLEI